MNSPGYKSSKGGQCLVGYGNEERRDDGVGPHVASALREKLAGREDVEIFIRRQLDPDIIEELSNAEAIILVDATLERLEGGWAMERLTPSLSEASCLTHVLRPRFLVGLFEAIHARRPESWLVSIQGEEFGHGRGLTPEVFRRAEEVTALLAELLSPKV